MGDFMDEAEGTFTAGSLNAMFGAANVATTFAQIEQLRVTFPRLLNPANNPGPKAARRQTLRFAAFLITDEVLFNGNYPAPKLKTWLKWLTWLGTQVEELGRVVHAVCAERIAYLESGVAAEADD